MLCARTLSGVMFWVSARGKAKAHDENPTPRHRSLNFKLFGFGFARRPAYQVVLAKALDGHTAAAFAL